MWDGSREDIFRNGYSLHGGNIQECLVSAWGRSREDTIRNGYSLCMGWVQRGYIQELYSLCMVQVQGGYIQEWIQSLHGAAPRKLHSGRLILNQEKLQKAFLWILKKKVTFLLIRIDYMGLERGLGG